MTVYEWISATSPREPPSEFYCATSDVWQGRFTKVAPALIKQGVYFEFAALVTAAIGEIGDNCFAHNAPNWIDLSGCWFEWTIEDGMFRCIIADRGRGILASLRSIRPALATHEDALRVALTERVSGRAPEKRGNGLKFVTDVLLQLSGGSFTLQSGNGQFQCSLPLDLNHLIEYIGMAVSPVRGVYSELITKMQYAS